MRYLMKLDRRQWLAITAGSLLLRTNPLSAREPATVGQFTFEDRHKQTRQITARVLVEAQDGGLLLQGTDGRIWQVTPDKLKQKQEATIPFAALSPAEVGQQLTQELGNGFVSYSTDHYALCTNASEAYARWCVTLLERLATAFRAYWTQREYKTVDHEFPLVAIVFQKQTQFAEFATVDVSPELATVPGYFSIPTNRIVLHDLTQATQGQPVRSSEEIDQRLGAAQYNVATMIHEATHQIAFNCGLHTRMADNPMWMTEGMATFFETPDLRGKAGWKTAGQINRPRLQRFKEFLAQRRADDSLQTLVRNDARLTDPKTAEDAYAESWALTYFLIRKKEAAYVKYLTHIAAKQPLDFPTQEQRLTEFQDAFGELEKLNTEFVKYVKPLR